MALDETTLALIKETFEGMKCDKNGKKKILLRRLPCPPPWQPGRDYEDAQAS